MLLTVSLIPSCCLKIPQQTCFLENSSRLFTVPYFSFPLILTNVKLIALITELKTTVASTLFYTKRKITVLVIF